MSSQDNTTNIPSSPEHATIPPKRPNPMKTLQVCRYYCLGGFFLLPCLWLVNVLWFFPEAFGHVDLPSGDPNDDRPDETEIEAEERRKRIRTQARRYVIISGLGALLSSLALGAWVYLYQTRRSLWGAYGDSISLIIPRGKP